jgi:hypothetical protein
MSRFLVFILLIFSVQIALSQDLPTDTPVLSPAEKLSLADSLFGAKRYTQSFQLYEELLRDDNLSSASMLLKMAYIKEGLNNPADALYYLNLYYLKTSDKEVLQKMETLADEKGLRGYDFNDFEFFKTIFYRYYSYLIYFLFALAFLLLAISYYQKFKKQRSPAFAAAGMVIVLGLLFYTLNFGLTYNRGIIMQNQTYLMEGPSAGAEVLAIIDKGHRMELKGETDVWVKSTWDDQTVYIKNTKIRPITF